MPIETRYKFIPPIPEEKYLCMNDIIARLSNIHMILTHEADLLSSIIERLSTNDITS
jgi:hypothetical protein